MGADEGTYSIKQVADMLGNTRGAIRFFQEKGLVDPQIDANGFRHYTMDDIFQLLHLRSFAAMSFSLDEVAGDLRRESETPLEDIVGLARAHADDLRSQMARLQRQLEKVEDFRQSLLDACGGAVRLEQVGAYWSLRRPGMERMLREDPALLARLVALIPQTIIGRTWDLADTSGCKDAELRIRADHAMQAGMEAAPYFHVLPACAVALRTFACDAANVDAQARTVFSELAAHLREHGMECGDVAFTRLVFVHTERGVPVEYHTAYLPARDARA